jgi:chemotaxis protein CheD
VDAAILNAIEIFLQPGEVMFAGEDTWLVTLLGSCVAITLWHPLKRLGGMCHIVLPHAHEGKDVKGDGRYAREAVQMLQGAVRNAGLKPAELEIKIFGGGSMLSDCSSAGNLVYAIPARNVAVAKMLVEQAGWNLMAEHTGGRGYRQVKFDISTGEVWLRYSPLPDCKFCAAVAGCGSQTCGRTCD